jgi:hypothetical protein
MKLKELLSSIPKSYQMTWDDYYALIENDPNLPSDPNAAPLAPPPVNPAVRSQGMTRQQFPATAPQEYNSNTGEYVTPKAIPGTNIQDHGQSENELLPTWGQHISQDVRPGHTPNDMMAASPPNATADARIQPPQLQGLRVAQGPFLRPSYNPSLATPRTGQDL